MKQRHFIEILQSNLSFLPKERQKEIVADYEEHFAEGLSKGQSEEEISQRLGDPKLIAKQYKIQNIIGDEDAPLTIGKALRIIYVGLSIAFVNLIFVVGFYIGLIGAYLGIFVTNVAMIATSLILIFIAIWPFSSFGQFASVNSQALTLELLPVDRFMFFFLGLGFLSLFVILLFGTLKVGKWIAKGTVKYIQNTVSIIVRAGGSSHA